MVRETKDMLSLRLNRGNRTHGLLGGVGQTLMAVDTPEQQIGVIHRWSNNIGPYPLGRSNDQVVVYNFGNNSLPAFELTGLPYDGEWSVVFNGDDPKYSRLYAGECTSSAQQAVVAAAGRAKACVPPLSMLVLTHG